MKHGASRIRTEILQPNTSPPVLPPVLQNFSPGFQGHFLGLGRRGVRSASVVDGNVGLASIWCPNAHKYFLILISRFYLLPMAKNGKKPANREISRLTNPIVF